MKRRELSQQINALVDATRTELESVYAAALDSPEKRERKIAVLASLQRRVADHLERVGRDPSPWLDGELNNARLVPMTLYEGRLPEFRELFQNCEQRFDCFYSAARELARR